MRVETADVATEHADDDPRNAVGPQDVLEAKIDKLGDLTVAIGVPAS